MKKALWLSSVAAVAMTAASAQGADLRMPVKAPPPVPPPVFSWTGCYVGLHGGWGSGRTNWSDQSPGLPDFPDFFFVGGFFPGSLGTNKSGGLGGGQIGCDYQVNNWVFGLEGSASATGIRGDAINPFFVNQFGDAKTLHTETDWLASVTPRIGYSWDRLLIYARGGVAWSHNKYHAFDPADVATFDQSATRTGWVIGGGLEYAFLPGWSAFVEYAHYDFGSTNLVFSSPTFGATYLPVVNVSERLDVVKAGINLRFTSFLNHY